MPVVVQLGKSQEGRVDWEPGQEKNPHFLVVGTSGSGKTESLKTIIQELQKQGVPSLAIDFHNEYGDIAEERLNMRQLTINPLEVAPGKRPQDVVYEVANIIKKIFRLGDRQEALLRAAIRECYASRKIDPLKEAAGPLPAPPFLDVRERILELRTPANAAIAESLLNRIEALFEVEIFRGDTAIPFEGLVGRTTALELKDFPTEDVKAAIAEFFLNKLIYFVYQWGKSGRLRLYCVVDEAHRLLYENSPLDRLLREARKYGVGVILSSQRPTDFSETVLANTGGLLSLQCNLEKDARFIAKQMGIDYREILNLNEAGLAYLRLTSRPGTVKLWVERPKVRSRPKAPAPVAGQGTGELHGLQALLESRERELLEARRQLQELREQKRRVENELQNMVRLLKASKERHPPGSPGGHAGRSVGGKLCRGCSFINEGDASYCTDCGRKL